MKSNLWSFILSSSGGLVYHLRALVFGRGWSQTRSQATSLLLRFIDDARLKEITLIGPSAGYLLDPSTLDKGPLETIRIIEPDPVARWIFRLRFRKTKVKLTFETHTSLLPRPEHRGIVYWGVLGQKWIDRALDSKTQTADQRDLLTALSDYRWASLHDSYSGNFSTAPMDSKSFSGEKARELEVTRALEHGATELIDHETQWLDDSRSVDTIAWPLTKKRTHFLHWVQN